MRDNFLFPTTIGSDALRFAWRGVPGPSHLGGGRAQPRHIFKRRHEARVAFSYATAARLDGRVVLYAWVCGEKAKPLGASPEGFCNHAAVCRPYCAQHRGRWSPAPARRACGRPAPCLCRLGREAVKLHRLLLC